MRRSLPILLLALFLTSCLPPAPNAGSTLRPPATEGTVTASAPPVPSITPPGNVILPRLAWFYKPPFDDNDLYFLAHAFDFFILTRGDETERDQLLNLGVRQPILQYLRFDAIHMEEDCSARPRRNQVAYREGDYCDISANHPDWFLLNRQGERIYQEFEDQTYVMMDPGSPGWRAFFLERVRDSQSDAHWGGVFLDNFEVTFSFRETYNQYPLAYADEASYLAASQGMLEMLQNEFFKPSGKLLFANIAARRGDTEWMAYLTHLDGAMNEGWAVDWPDRFRSAERWERQMTLAEETQAAGKFIILVSQGTQGDVELQRFAYASYLLINQGRAAFRYGNSANYREVWYYSDYDSELGQPLGPRYAEGDAWRRDYEFGSVMVNPHTHKASISIK